MNLQSGLFCILGIAFEILKFSHFRLKFALAAWQKLSKVLLMELMAAFFPMDILD